MLSDTLDLSFGLFFRRLDAARKRNLHNRALFLKGRPPGVHRVDDFGECLLPIVQVLDRDCLVVKANLENIARLIQIDTFCKFICFTVTCQRILGKSFKETLLGRMKLFYQNSGDFFEQSSRSTNSLMYSFQLLSLDFVMRTSARVKTKQQAVEWFEETVKQGKLLHSFCPF